MAWPVVFIAVMVGDLTVPYLLAPFCKGYSHKKMVMSYLGNIHSGARRLYNGWLFLGGAAFLLCSLEFYRHSTATSRLALPALVLMLWYAAGGMVLSGLFPTGTTKKLDTLSAKIHGVGSTTGFMALLFVPLLFSADAKSRGDAAGLLLSAACFALALTAFVLFVMADKPRYKATAIDNEGIWQRLTLLFLYLPIIHRCLRAVG